jgi:two-component system, cell cycle sensor histidine kinase and response regulator CckA
MDFMNRRIDRILNALKKAAGGDYSAKLHLASKDDELERVADAVNILFKKLDEQSSTSSKTSDQSVIDARRYGNIIESMEESYIEIDLKGNITFLNERLLLDLGYSGEELRGLNFRNLMDAETAQRTSAMYHDVFVTGRPVKGFEYTFIKKSGEKIDAEVSVRLLRDEDGKPIGFGSIVRNISKRKQAERALQRSEERYRNILQNMEDCYVEADLKGNYVFFNDAICRLLGYSREELMNRSYKEIDSPETQQRIMQEYSEVYRTGQTKHFIPGTFKTKDGSIRHAEMTVSLRRSPTGEPIGFATVTRDITEQLEAQEKLRQSEEKYRSILESMEEGYHETDLKGNYVFFNDAFCRVLGYTREELQSLNYKRINLPEDNQRIAEEFNKVYRTGKPSYSFYNRVISKDGAIKHREHSIALRRSPKGEPIGFAVISRDITEKLEAEQKIKESEEKYRNILQNMEETYLETDLRGNYTFFND